MSCSNCYNGCPQIVSDQCVRYTGIDIPVLGIKNGDSLSYVEQAIITFLTSTLDGTGVKPNVEPSIICDIVKKYLPTCGDLSVVDFITAIIKAACDIQGQVTALKTSTESQINDINDILDELNATYTGVGSGTCLTSVNGDSGTHAIVQAVIDQLCNVTNTYVELANLDTLIGNYLSGLPGASKYYTKMIPFVAVPFFPTPAIEAKFNGTGAGQDEWEKIYYCNGENGTPDLRGRVPVGATTGMVGATLSPVVAPGGLNPDYQLGTNTGANGITLSKPQMPTHNHTGSGIVVELNDPKHGHNVGTTGNQVNVDPFRSLQRGDDSYDPYAPGAGPGPVIETSLTGITVSKQELTIVSEGGNQAHSNVQPGIGSFYIMYIP